MVCVCIHILFLFFFRFSFPHPYQKELENFDPDFNNVQKVEPQEPEDLSSTPLTFVTTLSDLEKMCDALKSCKEIAVDLEVRKK